ncbi:hypothetical protein [Planotetraspora sp. GP83]|uniref:hypothetical protein n=1 Tax=Planotetraspora sp. GP83 TaxID=3156264 RepID=UPI0035115CE2
MRRGGQAGEAAPHDATGDHRPVLREAYAHYRRSLSDRPDGRGELWTTERARKESFATVLATFWYRQRYGLLDIGVGLSATMTTFRWDLSSHAVIITVEDPNRALTALSGTFYYESCGRRCCAGRCSRAATSTG